MCYNGSMKRIDVLKGVEQILVQKAYETGHISHRADGDWQKQTDGSWIPYKGQSNQSTPQAQEPAPTENTEYGEIVQQDFESVPKSIKDKMFTIAQQYQSEWAEDSDEDMRSMAEDDVEAISQMLWDTADEETRNSWIGSEDSDNTITEDEESSGSGVYGDIENYDFADLDDYNSMISSAFNAESGIFDDDDELTDIATQYAQDHDIEDTDNNINWIRNKIMGHAERLFADDSDIEKSAVRDMRSAPITKNMGF